MGDCIMLAYTPSLKGGERSEAMEVISVKPGALRSSVVNLL